MADLFLLDSNALFWSLSDPAVLGSKARTIIKTAKNEIYFSEVSLFELAIKKSKGGLKDMAMPSIVERSSIDTGFRKLAFDALSFDRFITIPFLHKDPFDRMLIAQAMRHNMTVMTSDRIFKKYDIDVVLI